MKDIGIFWGFSWERGFGLGFRVSWTWKCKKDVMFTLDFANIKLIVGVVYFGKCTCKKATL